MSSLPHIRTPGQRSSRRTRTALHTAALCASLSASLLAQTSSQTSTQASTQPTRATNSTRATQASSQPSTQATTLNSSQTSTQTGSSSASAPLATTLTIEGHTGAAPLLQHNGRAYIDLESLTRLSGGALRFQGNAAILSLAPADTTTTETRANPGFSRAFLNAAIEQLTDIREWRSAIVNAVQNNYPVSGINVPSLRRAAETRLAMTAVAASTDSDRQALALLQNEFNNMHTLSNTYLQRSQNSQFTQSNSIDNDPLNAQILACAQGLANLASLGHFEDVAACH